mmetsp:Transcript_11134/g.36776  ORF Transcript_11134/g.36776 Transcript_11134/m.36776 type:complete len:264 (+) Transcript_11134:774-1565(+)
MNSMKRTSMGRARASAAKASTSCSFTPGVGEDGFGYRGGRGEGLDLVLVHTAHHHAVQLERRVPQRQRRVHRAQHLWQRVAPRQLEESTPLQRVEREVELVEAGGVQRGQQPRQRHTVGCHRDLAQPERPQPVQRADDCGQVGPNRRLASREADLVDSGADEEGGEAEQLLRREEPPRVRERHAVRGHAVRAAQRAALGERDAEVRVAPAVAVVQAGRERRCVELHRPGRRRQRDGALGQRGGAAAARRRAACARPATARKSK